MTLQELQPVVERTAVLGDLRGIHGRTARTIVSIVTRFDVSCTIFAPDLVNRTRDASGQLTQVSADGRSILQLMTLGASYQTPLRVRVEGARAVEAADALCQYIGDGPFVTYVSISEGSNSDPALRDMAYVERDAHLERLSAIGAANIPRWKRPWCSDYGSYALDVAKDCVRRGIPTPPEIKAAADAERLRIDASRSQ